MHSKRKGNIGQAATALCLAELGFSVFSEVGDISKIDLIAERDGKLLRFQCKAITSRKGRLIVPLRKCGPNYRFHYFEGQFDYFAVFDLTDKKLYLLPASILKLNCNTFVLSKSPSGTIRSKVYNRPKIFSPSGSSETTRATPHRVMPRAMI